MKTIFILFLMVGSGSAFADSPKTECEVGVVQAFALRGITPDTATVRYVCPKNISPAAAICTVGRAKSYAIRKFLGFHRWIAGIKDECQTISNIETAKCITDVSVAYANRNVNPPAVAAIIEESCH